jgi:LacI family transcriptional regulator
VATIHDVARLAGVSAQTVSRVLTGTAPVSEKTRLLVEAAMAELRYIPSNAARSMRSQKSGLVGLIGSPVSSSSRQPAGLPSTFVVQGALDILSANGKTLLIADIERRPERVPELVQTLLEHRVEGLLYVADFHQRVDLPPIAREHALVLANCFDDFGTPAVVPDNASGGYDLVSALIAAGHRRIGFLTGPRANVSRTLRLEGYERAHIEAGIPIDPDLIEIGATPDQEDEFGELSARLDRLLATTPRPSVVCCANDKMAMRVYGLLRHRGLEIPNDISVAGYDDYLLICEQLHPQLTSVNLPYREIGVRAAERLLDIIATGKPVQDEQPERVGGPLAWRESTAHLIPSANG